MANIILIAGLPALAVGLVLGILLYRALKTIGRLEAFGRGQLREIERLKKWLRKYEGVQQKVALTLPEKHMILNALEAAQYRARVQEPKTKRYVRNVYNTLIGKIREAIKEYAG